MSWADSRIDEARRRSRGVWCMATATAGLVAVLVSASIGGAAFGPSRIRAVPASAKAITTLSVSGHGFGHGRGMSQWGAYGAATEGLSYSSILAFYYQGTTLSHLTDPTMRVEIGADDDDNAKVYPASGLTICHDGTERNVLSTSSDIHAWRLARSSSQVVLQYYRDGGWHTSGLKLGGSYATFTRSSTCSNYGSSAVTLGLPGGGTEGIRGGVRGALYSTGLRTVGVMSMTNYLYGVVASEMPASWATQALEAQSVAARTYAAHYRQVIGATHQWDICDSTSCQVFHGTGGEASSTNAAVAATAGRMLTYKGDLAETEFSASNGGYTVSGGEPYLVAKADPYDGAASSYPHSWTDTVSGSSLHKAFPGVGTVTGVRVVSRDGHGVWGGRTESVEVVGTSGSQTVSGSTFAHAAGLLSIWWTVPTPPSHDLSGDGHPDLLVRETGTGALRVYDGRGTGGFVGVQSRGSGWQAMSDLMLAGDLDSDGRADLVAMNTDDGNLWLYPGDGNGWVGAPTRIGRGFQIFSMMAPMGDVTGDGIPDLAGVVASTGDLRIYPGNGAGGVHNGIRIGGGWSVMNAIVGAGDVNGDHHPDLVARNKATGALWLYAGNGKGGFANGVSLGGRDNAYSLLTSPGDWNGDGHPDLLAVDKAAGTLIMFAGNGSGYGTPGAIGGHGWEIFDAMA